MPLNLDGLSQQSRLDLFDRFRRYEALISKLGVSLAQEEHKWSDEERKAYDWAARTLERDIQELATDYTITAAA